MICVKLKIIIVLGENLERLEDIRVVLDQVLEVGGKHALQVVGLQDFVFVHFLEIIQNLSNKSKFVNLEESIELL